MALFRTAFKFWCQIRQMCFSLFQLYQRFIFSNVLLNSSTRGSNFVHWGGKMGLTGWLNTSGFIVRHCLYKLQKNQGTSNRHFSYKISSPAQMLSYSTELLRHYSGWYKLGVLMFSLHNLCFPSEYSRAAPFVYLHRLLQSSTHFSRHAILTATIGSNHVKLCTLYILIDSSNHFLLQI